MKGRVLEYEDNAGVGQISGDDGKRYNFTRADLKRLIPISAGDEVDFDSDGRAAKDIFILSAATTAIPYTGAIEPDLGMFGYFKRAITSYFVNFSGRARRKEYWSFWNVPFVVYLVLGLALAMAMAMGMNGPSQGGGPTGLALVLMVVMFVFALGILIPGLAVQVRRLHDIGQSGWILLLLIVLSFVPVLNLVVFLAYIVLGCIDSQPNSNKYGVPPKQVA